MRTLLCLSLCVAAAAAFAKTIPVGATRAYASPSALWRAIDADPTVMSAGDVVEIDAGTYRGQAATAVWVTDGITVRGVGGEVRLVADGAYVRGKGIFVSAGEGITYEDLTFEGATVPDGNGAGIRQDGPDMVVRRCTFRGNQNGILTSNETPDASGAYRGTLLVEYCVFDGNGNTATPDLTHNVYVGRSARCDFRYNYCTAPVDVHAFKSRAQTNVLAYNRISDGPDATRGRLVDLSNGGLALLIGNELLQGPNAQNRELIGYGPEGYAGSAPHRLYLAHNTLVNRRTAGAVFVGARAGAEAVELLNNFVVGPGELTSQPPTRDVGTFRAVDIAAAGFVDAAADDYRLTPGSPAVAAGAALANADGFEFTPDAEYVHVAASVSRARSSAGPDVGAHGPAGTLPVEYSAALAATLGAAGVTLTWATASEDDCARFVVERSARGGDETEFAAIDSVACVGRASEYALLDPIRPANATYYRLRQVDLDGAATLSEAVVVSPTSGTSEDSPGFLRWTGNRLTNGSGRALDLAIGDALGRPAARLRLGDGDFSDLGHLPPGVYYVSVGASRDLPAVRVVIH